MHRTNLQNQIRACTPRDVEFDHNVFNGLGDNKLRRVADGRTELRLEPTPNTLKAAADQAVVFKPRGINPTTQFERDIADHAELLKTLLDLRRIPGMAAISRRAECLA